MAKFKCIYTGNITEFTQPFDIESMRKHGEYVEMVVVAPLEKKKATTQITEESV